MLRPFQPSEQNVRKKQQLKSIGFFLLASCVIFSALSLLLLVVEKLKICDTNSMKRRNYGDSQKLRNAKG